MSKDETNREHVRADLGAAEGKAMTKDEKNRLIAEWVGLRPTTDGWWPQPDGKAFPFPPDFFISEEANALVLEKLPAAELYHHAQDGHAGAWRCRADWGQDESTYSNEIGRA